MRIGWIGLGAVGTGMVRDALAAGHSVSAFARGSGQDEARAAGAVLSSDYNAIAAGCETLGICVYDDDQLRSTLFGQGALASMRPGSVLVVHKTGSPRLAREIAAAAPPGVETLDACFSIGRDADGIRHMTLMVGGSADGLERARPLLATYSRNIHHIGPAGSGQTTKLLNNLSFATNLRFASEVMRVAAENGIEPATVAQVIQSSSGASGGMAMFVNGDTVSQVRDRVHHYLVKDVKAAASAATSSDIDFSAFGEIVNYYAE